MYEINVSLDKSSTPSVYLDGAMRELVEAAYAPSVLIFAGEEPRMRRSSPTFHAVMRAENLRGCGRRPSFTRRQIVAAELANSA